MMLNDAVIDKSNITENITSFSTKGKDMHKNSLVIVELDNGVILRLQNRFQGHESEEINFLLDKKLEDKICESILIFKGKTKIRKDVLKKLKAIADLISNQSIYPKLRRQTVLVIVKNILVEPDPRVVEEYMKTIGNFIKSSHGKNLTNYEEIDMSPFVNAVYEKYQEI